MTSVTRKILSPQQTASLGPGQLSLRRSAIHHAHMRIQQLSVDLFALYDKAPSGSFKTGPAQLQGMQGKENSHGAHNTLDAGVKDTTLQEIRDRCLARGYLDPWEKELISQVYGWHPEKAHEIILTSPHLIEDKDSLLWADQKPGRHHTTDLPRWINLSVDKQAENLFRPLFEKAKEDSLHGRQTPEEILNQVVPILRDHFEQASENCKKMAEKLKQLNRAEKKFIHFTKKVKLKNHGLSLHDAKECLVLLRHIRSLQREIRMGLQGTPLIRDIPTSIPKVLHYLPRRNPSSMMETLLFANRALRNYEQYGSNHQKIWAKRNDRIDHFLNLRKGNYYSAKGTVIPPLHHLFPASPSEQKKLANRLTRKPGQSTPQFTPNNNPKPRTPYRVRKIPFSLPEKT